jgi:phenylacetate-CoA ligase
MLQYLMRDPYGVIVKNLLLPIGDRLRGISIGQTLSFLEGSQRWDRGRLEAYRDSKLRLIIDTAYHHVPYYRDAMRNVGVTSEDIKTPKDLSKLPVLTRSTLRRRPIETFCNSTVDVARTGSVRTGGSTGEPLTFHVSKASRAFDRATHFRLYRWCGIERGDRVFLVWGNPTPVNNLKSRANEMKRRYISRTRVLDAFQMNPETQARFLADMRHGGKMVLSGYTSALVNLAHFARESGFELPRPRALVTTAEPVYPEQRHVLSRAFCAPVHDQYGCAEVNGVAMQCEELDGLHISEEHVVVEILDQNDQPVPPGVEGRIVLTNLDNEVMPFIRYDSGDIGSLRSTLCACGRTLSLMEPVRGRMVDVIQGLNGNSVYGTFFFHVLSQSGWFEALPLSEFQVVQIAADRLNVSLVSGRYPRESERRQFVDRVQAYLGPMDIEIHRVEALRRSPGGKLRYTIRQWKGGGPANTALVHQS